ncbi:MAG: hypothetical protein ABI969_09330, partial [bacterium]
MGFKSAALAVALVITSAAVACRSGARLPAADDIVEGRVAVPVDTIEEGTTVSLEHNRYSLRRSVVDARDFWESVAILDVASANAAARTLDERTFSLALTRLMLSDPDGASIAFRALHMKASDPAVRARARIGLTMALSWKSDWPALSAIGTDRDSTETADPEVAQAGVERWGHALFDVPVPVMDVPSSPVTLPMRRSAFGTPVVTVRV